MTDNGLNRNIGRFFDQQSLSRMLEYEKHGLDPSAQLHLSAILTAHAESVIDVGSGPGSLIMELLTAEVPHVIGVELSQHMNVLAKDRIQKKGLTGATLLTGDFLTVSCPPATAISFHKSLCCHPQREALLKKSIGLHPQLLTITVPRDWKLLKYSVNFYYKLLQLLNLHKLQYRPHIHSQNAIDAQLLGAGYSIIQRHHSLFWTTTIYKK